VARTTTFEIIANLNPWYNRFQPPSGVFPGKDSGLSDGSVTFVDTTGLIVEDNDGIFFDSTNIRLGIGTDSPTKTGHFKHATEADVIVDSGGTYTGGIKADSDGITIGSTSNHATIFRQNDTEYARVHTNGNVGIGITPGASAKLDIDAGNVRTQFTSDSFYMVKAGNGHKIHLRDSDSTQDYVLRHDDTRLSFATETVAAEKMVLLATGNLGVGPGMTAPDGIIEAYHTSSADIIVNQNGTCKGELIADSNEVSVGSITAHPTRFIQNDTEYMRVHTNGFIGIGETDPAMPLHLTKTAVGGSAFNANTVLAIEHDGYSILGMVTGTADTCALWFGDDDDPLQGGLLYSNASDELQSYTDSALRTVIDSDGFMGINESDPDCRLDVGGSIGFAYLENADLPAKQDNKGFIYVDDDLDQLLFKDEAGNTYPLVDMSPP